MTAPAATRSPASRFAKARASPQPLRSPVRRQRVRDWLVLRARSRVASGFYDTDECMNLALGRMLGDVLTGRAPGKRAGRYAGREGPQRTKPDRPRPQRR